MRIENQLAVVAHNLKQSTSPANTLTVQRLQGGRPLCPAANLRHLRDAERLTAVLHVRDHTQQHVHVLSHTRIIIAAGFHHDVRIKQSEATRDVGQGIDGGPPQFTNQE